MSKGKVYGVTISEAKTNDQIAQFKQLKGLDSDAKAVAEIVKRYFMLSFEQREVLEKKVDWAMHRNRGHRKLTTFLPKAGRVKP